jgi:hypothetical protein
MVGRPLSVLRVDIRQYEAFVLERTAILQLYAGNHSTGDRTPSHLDQYLMSTPHLAQSSPAVAAVMLGPCVLLCSPSGGHTRRSSEIMRQLRACRYKAGPCTPVSTVVFPRFCRSASRRSACFFVEVVHSALLTAHSEQSFATQAGHISSVALRVRIALKYLQHVDQPIREGPVRRGGHFSPRSWHRQCCRNQRQRYRRGR